MRDGRGPQVYGSEQPTAAPYGWPQPPVARRAASRVPLAVALGVAVVGAVLAVVSILLPTGGTGDYRTIRVPSGSMEPTYPEGSDVTVMRIDGSEAARGRVVVFSARDWGVDQVFMQRVIGVGGDHVVISETGRVSVDNKTLREPYLSAGDPAYGPPVEVIVPPGRLFLLGDHRVAAVDSRAHLSEHSGTIARSAVVGMVVDHASVPSSGRPWMWVGAATAAVGLVAAAVAATVRRTARGSRISA
ncbi:signal peptidase I [Streptomyces sp. NPDC048521]|uniref:signal peptidase I n=1 Tax=Streptomyces sp. NPDC048521 TaxID=3365566 RepID=UPI00370FA1BB